MGTGPQGEPGHAVTVAAAATVHTSRLQCETSRGHGSSWQSSHSSVQSSSSHLSSQSSSSQKEMQSSGTTGTAFFIVVGAVVAFAATTETPLAVPEGEAAAAAAAVAAGCVCTLFECGSVDKGDDIWSANIGRKAGSWKLRFKSWRLGRR